MLLAKFPYLNSVMQFKHCKYNGVCYSCGLYVIDGFQYGLPTFCKIEAIVEQHGEVYFLSVSQYSHYVEAFHSYEVEDSGVYHIHAIRDLVDYYPLPGYNMHNQLSIPSSAVVEHKTLVTLKHFVSSQVFTGRPTPA